MLKVRANVSGALSSIRAMRSRRREARTAAVRAIVGEKVSAWVAEAPRDTNRYVRAWAQAAIAVGAEGVWLPELQRSRYAELYVEAFQRRVGVLEGRLASVTTALSRGYTDRWVRGRRVFRKLSPSARSRLDRRAASLRARIDRTNARLRQFLEHEHAIVLGAGRIIRTGERWQDDDEKVNYLSFDKKRSNPTVRFRVYGGTGILRHSNDKTTAVLRNKEPHAWLVEFRIIERMLKTRDALQKAKREYARHAARAASTLRYRVILAERFLDFATSSTARW